MVETWFEHGGVDDSLDLCWLLEFMWNCNCVVGSLPVGQTVLQRAHRKVIFTNDLCQEVHCQNHSR